MTTAQAAAYKDGLEDVIAARSAICRVDGEAGRLYYRGYEVGRPGRARASRTRRTCCGSASCPAPPSAPTFAARLAEARPLPAPVLDLLRRLPRDCHPLDALRTAVSLAAAARSGRALQRARREPAQGLSAHEPGAGHGGRLAAPPHRPRAGARGAGRLARGALPHAARGAGAVGGSGAGARRHPHPARGPRVQRLHLRGARGGGHGGRPALRDRRRHLHAQGTAPRRRQRGRAARCCSRSASRSARRPSWRRGWARGRACRSASAPIPKARMPGLRPPRLQGGRRAGARATRHGQVDGGGHRARQALRGGRARSTTP